MQYWKPEDPREFAGDMMPYWDGERFHLFYLLDHDHHADQGGLGGHQWAHAATSDLVNWQHYPLAVPIGAPGSVDQHGICTGSIFEHDGAYHAFYATRIKQSDGSVAEMLCQASGTDLIHFEKSPQNPMFGAGEGFEARNFRDPFVFLHEPSEEFQMLVSSSSVENRGVLAHYTSNDLRAWQLRGPFLPPAGDHHVPECPEVFQWNDWWYLIYGHNQQMDYWIARDSLGPWTRARRDGIESLNLVVPRTAEFSGNRRLAVGFLQWKRNDRDEEDYVYAGNAVFRELIQDPDGTLWTRFVPEMMPPTVAAKVCALDGAPIPLFDSPEELEAGDAMRLARVSDVPADAILRLHLKPKAGTGEFGLLLRADEKLENGYRLLFTPAQKKVVLQRVGDNTDPRAVVFDVEVEEGVDVVICMKEALIDVCLNERHTLIERAFNHRGTNLGLFVRNGAVSVESLSIAEIA